MEQARILMSRKDAIQAELDAQFSILASNQSTLQSPLIDSEGFPRADIDIYAVRHARVRIIELRNDLNAVMDEIGKALEKVYDPVNGNAVQLAASTTKNHGKVNGTGAEKPFAKVDGVAPGSPAAQAVYFLKFISIRTLTTFIPQGLLREDLIIQFGPLISTSFTTTSLQPIAELVGQSEDVRGLFRLVPNLTLVKFSTTEIPGTYRCSKWVSKTYTTTYPSKRLGRKRATWVSLSFLII